jgi:AcrR family transcriptional regulator
MDTGTMPRITAPTVAEHRAAQGLALLRAAAEIVVEVGAAAVNPRSVGERAGLARSSVYEYFGSREELLVAVAIDAFDKWGSELSASVQSVEPGLLRLRAYIQATMQMAADGQHVLAAALRTADLSPRRVEEIVTLHDAFRAPLAAILAESGVDDVNEITPYVQALISAGLEQVGRGRHPEDVATRTYRLIVDGVPRPNAPG